MEHEEYKLWISQYIDGELEKEFHVELFQHLSVCDDCRDYLSQYLQLHDRLQVLTQMETVPKPYFKLKNFRDNTLGQKGLRIVAAAWNKRVPLPVAAMIAFLVLAIGISGSLFWSSTKTHEPAVTYIMQPIDIEGSAQ